MTDIQMSTLIFSAKFKYTSSPKYQVSHASTQSRTDILWFIYTTARTSVSETDAGSTGFSLKGICLWVSHREHTRLSIYFSDRAKGIVVSRKLEARRLKKL